MLKRMQLGVRPKIYFLKSLFEQGMYLLVMEKNVYFFRIPRVFIQAAYR